MIDDGDDEISAVTLNLGKNPIGDDGRYRVDRSNVPLCGRNTERDHLFENYSAVAAKGDDSCTFASRAVVIRGAAGTGKSALVESLRGSVTESTWFVSGKFCQYSNQNDPFSALVAAITDLIDLIVQQGAVELYRKDAKDAIEHQESAFARLIPNIGRLTGEDYEISFTEDAASPHHHVLAFAQFKASFTALLRALGRPEHPLVIFLDDIQWVDDESLELLKDFVGGLGESKHILLVGAVRTEESRGSTVTEALEGCFKSSNLASDREASALKNGSKGWKRTKSKRESAREELLTFIDVGNVDASTVAEIISVALDMPMDTCASLGNILCKKTMGNPFAVLQFLDLLVSEGKMELTQEGVWEWDETKVNSETDVSDNVVLLVERNLERLPKEVKNVLVYAAFLGFTFKVVELVELASETNLLTAEQGKEVAHYIDNCLARALKQGLIESVDSKYQDKDGTVASLMYKFSHDKICQACYDCVSERTEKQQIHLTIGRYLQRSGIRGKAGALDIAGHFNRARHLLLASREDRVTLAKANFAAAKVAHGRSAFSSSVSFLQIGLRTLDCEIKWTEEYDMALEMSRLLLEMCVACRKAEEVDLVVEEVLDNAKCTDDKLPVMQSKVVLLWSTCRYQEAIAYGCEALRLVGERVPKKPTKLQILMLFLQARRRVNRLSDEIFHTEPVKDDKIRFVMEMYSWLAPSAYYGGDSDLSMYLMLRSAVLSLEKGIHSMTPTALAQLGIVENAFGNHEVAFRNGRLAVRLADEFAPSAVAHTYVVAYTNLVHWTMPVEEVSNHFRSAMRTGMGEGDIVWAYICLAHSVFVDRTSGKPLELLERSLCDLCSKLTKFQMLSGLFMAQVVWQTCLNLLGASNQCTVLAGEAMNEAEHSSNPIVQYGTIQWYLLTNCKFQLACFVEETGQAEQLALELEKNQKFAQSFSVYGTKMHMALLWFQLAAGNKTRRGKKYQAKARAIVKYMKKMRGLGCPNFDVALRLCEAEEAALLTTGSIEDVAQLYDKAIEGAAGKVHLEAIAMEKAANFHVRRNSMDDGRRYYEASVSKYMEWNAYAKVEDMELKARDIFSLGNGNRSAVNVTVVVPQVN